MLSLLLFPACSLVSPAEPVEARPACDDPEVARRLVDVAGWTTPLPPTFRSPPVALEGAHQTADQEVPQLPTIRAWSRLCFGTLRLADGSTVDVGWDVLSVRSLGGSAWGNRPCVVGLDPQGRDCTSFARGEYPGLAQGR